MLLSQWVLQISDDSIVCGISACYWIRERMSIDRVWHCVGRREHAGTVRQRLFDDKSHSEKKCIRRPVGVAEASHFGDMSQSGQLILQNYIKWAVTSYRLQFKSTKSQQSIVSKLVYKAFFRQSNYDVGGSCCFHGIDWLAISEFFGILVSSHHQSPHCCS